MPSLANFNQTMRPYQEEVVEDALGFVAETQVDLELLPRRLYACPTGTGKGSMQLELLKRLRAAGVDAWIFSPALEVLRGALERTGVTKVELESASADKLAKLGEEIFVSTPLRYQNKVLAGEWDTPEVVIYDEAHHAIAENEVSGTLFALAPDAVWIGMTATPFRGTPKATALLREAWGEPHVVLTIPEAIHEGYMALPSFEVVGLVDDDQVKVVNGKFVQKQVAKKVRNVDAQLAKLVEERWDGAPTILIVPNTETAYAMIVELELAGVEAECVLAGTKTKDRAAIYERCRRGEVVIVCVAVLSEGVDFPWLGRIIDARPTLSPVEFVQRIGRLMRPKDFTPEYICVCRNLERFAFLLGGAVPSEVVVQAQSAFDAPSKRDGMRSIGYEAMARFKKITVPLEGGVKAAMFNVYSMNQETGVKTDWCILINPVTGGALVARKDTQTMIDDEGVRTYDNTAKWRRASLPNDLTGFATSQQTRKLSEKQKRWWDRAAGRHGLDANASKHLKRRQFQALPVLSQTKTNILEVK